MTCYQLPNETYDSYFERIKAKDLMTCYQLPNETYDSYFERIKAKLQQLLEHVNLREADQNIRIYKKSMYDLRALNTFQAGLLEPYRSFISYKAAVSLEDCLVQLRNYDNHKQQVNFLNFIRQKKPLAPQKSFVMNKPHTPSPANPPAFVVPNFQTTHNAYPTQFNRFDQQSTRIPNTSPFPRGPVQQSTRIPNTSPFPRGPVQVNRKPAESTSFGNNANKQQTFPKPTPMSICTATTAKPSVNSPYRHPNFFRSTGPPKFTVEELYNMEETTPIEYDPNFFRSTGPPKFTVEELYNMEETTPIEYDQSDVEIEPEYDNESIPHSEVEQSDENFQVQASTDPYST
ncbi:hypothetical protein QE152_g38748 [Popillia japonica]|uniref:Uncharacterized protein n=1 Tax=Popillia japonica TaxID=7064 RepID=A0AAW1HWJ6_POPJA